MIRTQRRASKTFHQRTQTTVPLTIHFIVIPGTTVRMTDPGKPSSLDALGPAGADLEAGKFEYAD